MAITITTDTKKPQKLGDQKILTGKITFGATYTAGGVAATPLLRFFKSGIKAIIIDETAGYTFKYDRTALTILVRHGTEISADIDMTGLISSVNFVAIGN